MEDCKPCRAERERVRRLGPAGGAIRARDNARWADPERRAKHLLVVRRGVDADREAWNARCREWYAANLERARERGRQAQQRHRDRDPEATRAEYQRQGRQRRARKAGAERCIVTERDLRRLANRQRHRCAYCGEDRQLTIEHVVPLARGGRHSIGNIVLACTTGNSGKRQRLLIEWRAWKGSQCVSR